MDARTHAERVRDGESDTPYHMLGDHARPADGTVTRDTASTTTAAPTKPWYARFFCCCPSGEKAATTNETDNRVTAKSAANFLSY